ncbi:MAG: hypothetical protein Q9191_001285 [Dirinaria sp. TL-2023a]
MDQLFDSLSEDWISQPRSPGSEQARRSSSLASSPSQSSNASQSRIPRLKPRLSSRHSAEATTQRRSSSIPLSASAKRPLSEKSSSKLNSFNNGQGTRDAGDKHKSSPKSTKAKNGQRPKNPATAISQDTVQVKLSPTKETANHGTPEWKRRLKSNSGSTEQQDLFSPIGLENVFRPPTIKVKAEERNRRQRPAAIGDKNRSPSRSIAQSGQLSASRTETNGEGARPSDLLLETVDEGAEADCDGFGEGVSNQELKAKAEGSSPGQHPSPGPSKRSGNGSLDGIQRRKSISSGERSATPTARISSRAQINEDPGLSPNISPSEHTRVTSGQTMISSEELSPCYVSRQDTIDGRINYATISDAEKVHQLMQEAMQQRQQGPESSSSNGKVNYAGQSSPPRSPPQCYSELTSHSLPEDLSTGTMEFVANGGFVNARRGGYSQEGSFLRRPLSPSSRVSQTANGSSPSTTPRRRSTGSLLEPLGKQAGPEVPPTTPRRQQAGGPSSHERPRSSGSPLKLFDKYDTFTNDRLSRRMSKFEEGPHDSVDQKVKQAKPRLRQSSSVSNFGEGALDDHAFTSSHPLQSHHSAKEDESPPLPENNASGFRFEESRDEPPDSHPRSKRKKRTSLPTDTVANLQKSANEELASNGDWKPTAEVIISAAGKRLPYSPAKDPKPKRRRTLLEAELQLDTMAPPRHSEVVEAATKTVLSRKRKDALYESSSQVADPSVLASRQMLRPRNPTPNQSGARGFYPGFMNSRVNIGDVNKQQHETPAMTVDASTEKLAEELAGRALNAAQAMNDGTRKPSVATADFFNEAQQIMQLIRAKGRPPSSHISEEEAASDWGDDSYDSDQLDSTKDQFSRPPSREGGSLRRVREPKQLDARVVSQLRKFRDTDDMGMTLSSSLKSLQIGQPTSMPTNQANGAHAGDEMESDVDIRILSVKPGTQQSSSATTDAFNTNSTTQMQSVGSHNTSGPSSGRSIPTDSSRGSKSRAVIAPETVAHLLSDQVAGMTFDHEKQVWVKSQNSKADKGIRRGHASSEATEEDLLGAIPDLSVDEIEELQRIKSAGSSLKNAQSIIDQVSKAVQDKLDKQGRVPNYASDDVGSRPQTADSKNTNPHDESSGPSKNTRFTSSGPLPETRATSWGGEAVGNDCSKAGGQEHADLHEIQEEEHAEEVEHEISILEGRVAQTPKCQNHRQPRVVTVAFSSPLVDQIEASILDEGSCIWDDADALNFDDSPVHHQKEGVSRSSKRTPNKFGRKQPHRRSSRRVSIGHQSFIGRPMSRLDEHEELSLVHCSNSSSQDKAVSTPLRKNSLIVPLNSAQASNVSFQLSPLPDFTVHEIDRPLDRVQAARGLEVHHWWQADQIISLSTQAIVSKLTDVEPYEPYWEHLRRMDLRSKGLATLHMLSGFCVRLEELDVSNNELREVNDAPASLRYLSVRQNALSSLTAWGHLWNLQYLDVSGNQLTDLRGFQTLVHLRELNADDNRIESLEGILKLDGLLRLRLRRNRIGNADFGDSSLKRLTHLDLCGNVLDSVSNIDRLTSLKHLNLSNNNLKTLDGAFSSPVSALFHVDVSNNELSSLDLANVPNLQTLNLDYNSIAQISSLSDHQVLQTLYWRSQSFPTGCPSMEVEYQACQNITNLYLSGNRISTFTPSSAFLNLCTLELASTGLQHLSTEFGSRCPNLRLLNLNFNAVSDLQPLLGILRLKELYLAGNRISRLRATAGTLKRLGQEFSELDLRMNPLSVGFYTPSTQTGSSSSEKQLMVRSPQDRTSLEASDPESEARSTPKDTQYLLPQLDREFDASARHRLDEDTKLRRRVYEMLLLTSCKSLERLDGLDIDQSSFLRRYDAAAWDQLKHLGVLRDKDSSCSSGHGG